MRDPRTPKHIKLLGQPDVAGAHLPLGVSKLEDEFRESPPYEIPHLTRYQVGPDYTTESRIHGDQHYVTVIGGAQCRDKLGFLLTRDGSGQNYDAAYNDGVVERINPIDGQPRPEPETADRTVGYKVPSQLRVAANSRVSASRFTGLMRLAVGCYHAAGKNAPFSFGFGKTHGILKFDVPVGNPAVMTPRYWVIEISSVGVFAAPIVNTGKCCDSWSITKYIPTAEEVAEQPSLEGFQTTLGLNWAFSVGRPGVLKLLSSTEMASAYSSGFPWYSGCGWAFSASGVSAQNVVVSSSSSPLPAHYLCSRFKISFSLQPNGTPAAAVTEEESNKIATFPEFSAVWIPTGSNNWFNSDFLTAFQIANMPFASQDAPVHVYYVGEQEIVTRWILTRSNQPLVLTPCTSNTLVQFLGTQRFCTEVYGSSVFSCQGINNFTIANPANPAIGMGDGGFKVSPDGNVKFGGSHTLTPAHSRVMAGFSSPHISTVFERSSKTVTETTTVQESPISGIYHNELVPPRLIPGEFTENPTNYMLDPSCYYTVNRPTFPFDPILITFCPVIEHYDETYALVYNRGFTGSENSSARTTVVPFLNEREALLHVYRNNQFRTGNDFTQSIVNDGQSYARLYSTRYKVADAASGIFPAGYLSCNYVGPWTAAGGSFFQSQGAFQSSLNPATTFGPNAAAQLNVGPLAVGAPVPSEATAGGFMPTTPLTVFVFGNFASPPAMIVEVASPVFAQHGNLYYDDPELEPTNQFGNAVYQLDSVVVTVGGFSDGATQYLAFVGKA